MKSTRASMVCPLGTASKAMRRVWIGLSVAGEPKAGYKQRDSIFIFKCVADYRGGSSVNTM